MNWNYPITNLEYTLAAIFLVFNLLYIGRTMWVARQVDTTSRAVVVKFFLRSIYFLLLLVSIVGPFFGEPEREGMSEGKDVFFLVDISKSMDVQDVQPSRLEKTKFELKRLVNVLTGNRYGLIVFSSEAFVQLPLTFDMNAFELFLETLNTNQTSSGGTDICSAIELAIQKETANNNPKRTTKVLVLLTDGEDFGTCEDSNLSKLRQYGITLIVVGIGSAKGGPIKKGNEWLKDDNQELVTSRLDAKYLKNLCQKTNSQYIEIDNTNNGFGKVTEAIDTVPNSLIDGRKVLVTSNRYQYFLVLALILIVFDVLVTITTFEI
jgi:Ca-activated chloride channel homolog